MSPRFAGKHCVVVGATGLIGSHIASAFARHGAVVSLLGRSAIRARSVLEPQLPPYHAPPDHAPDTPSVHRFLPLDAVNPDAVKRLFAAPPSKVSKPLDFDPVGPLDILVNCAGISQSTLLKRTPDAQLSRILDTNLLATIMVCKHARIRPNGCIINVSSLMATKAGLGAAAYAASKAGVIAFTRALCLESSARSIRVNALLPGWVDSPMWNVIKPQLKEATLRDTPLHRVGKPDEVADAAVFLASNEFANNCVLNLDGGLSAV